MSDEKKIMQVFGWEAGQELTPAEAFKRLAIEMLGHRSDLQEPIKQRRAADDREREEWNQQAELLERYAVIAYALAVQMSPESYRVESMGGLLELAEKHKITLPEWMKAK